MTGRALQHRRLLAIAFTGLLVSVLAAVPHARAAAATVTCPSVAKGTGVVSPRPKPGDDWSGCNLKGANLDEADLSGVDLSDALLTDAKLTGADLSGTDMSGTTLTGVTSGGLTGTPTHLPSPWLSEDGYLIGPSANLAGASLAGQSLPTADLASADLERADLSSADLDSANLTGATIYEANLTGTDLGHATLKGAWGQVTGVPSALPANWFMTGPYLAGPGANLTLADLAGADLAGKDLAGGAFALTEFGNADLAGTDLAGGTFGQAGFNGANLSGADLAGAWIWDSGFGGTDLSGTDFTGTTLLSIASGGISGRPAALPAHWALRDGWLAGPGADFVDANLSGVDFARTDLANANFDNARLSGASLAAANLSWASLVSATVTDANLSGANLSHAGMIEAVLSGADLFRASLSGVVWQGTTCPDGSSSDRTGTCQGALAYRFTGLAAPRPGSTLSRSARAIAVTFRLAGPGGASVTDAIAASLAAAHEVRVTLSGPGIRTAWAFCAWTKARVFRCWLRTPRGLKTGRSHRYWLAVQENYGTGFALAPASLRIANPAPVYFR